MTAGDMSAEDSKKAVEKAKKLLPKEATIVKEDDWGVRELAYHIKKNAKARLVQVLFVSESAPIKDLNKQLNLEEGILRYLLLKHHAVKEAKIEVKSAAKSEVKLVVKPEVKSKVKPVAKPKPAVKTKK